MNLMDELYIAAPRPLVWTVTTDIERWPEWTPTMTRVERLDAGPLRVGSAARIEHVGLPRSRWVVTELIDGERFIWETILPGLRMVAGHRLAPAGTGTDHRLTLEIGGLVRWMAGPVLRRRALSALRAENRGLKAHCESLT